MVYGLRACERGDGVVLAGVGAWFREDGSSALREGDIASRREKRRGLVVRRLKDILLGRGMDQRPIQRPILLRGGGGEEPICRVEESIVVFAVAVAGLVGFSPVPHVEAVVVIVIGVGDGLDGRDVGVGE